MTYEITRINYSGEELTITKTNNIKQIGREWEAIQNDSSEYKLLRAGKVLKTKKSWLNI